MIDCTDFVDFVRQQPVDGFGFLVGLLHIRNDGKLLVAQLQLLLLEFLLRLARFHQVLFQQRDLEIGGFVFGNGVEFFLRALILSLLSTHHILPSVF